MRCSLKQKALSCVLAFTLASTTILLGGCFPEGAQIQPSNRNMQDASAVTADLKQKYEPTQAVDYVEGEVLVARDHQFTISYDFDPIELGMTEYPQTAALYYDSELTQRVPTRFEWAGDDKKSYTISPWEYPKPAVHGDSQEEYPYGAVKGKARLFDRGENKDWGNMGTLYLATWVDLTTGAPLDKPSVQVITFKGELDAPVPSMEITTEGIAQLSWEKVRGAEAYYIIKLTTNEDGSPGTANVIGQTTETTWSSKATASYGDVYITNKDFRTYRVSEDEWLSPNSANPYQEGHDPANGAVINESVEGTSFCVIAVNETGTSMFSRAFNIKEIAAWAPESLAHNMEKLSEGGFRTYIKGISTMPSYRWIVLCNGTLSQRIVNYDFDDITEETQTLYRYDDEDEDPIYTLVPTDVLSVPYTVDGTAFTGTLNIVEYDQEDVEGQLKVIADRQESLRNKTGDVKREIKLEDEEEPESTGEENDAGEEIAVPETVVTANSALSEYLALNMLSGTQAVDLSAFPEALDQEYLADAWGEAYYQNPLILGISDIMLSRDGKTLSLTYEDDQISRERKQAEITSRVEQTVSEIITSSMTAPEKERAINQYLCDTVTYDTDALKNAEQYDFAKVDSEFYDSFTAYGALINGVGVCASYAASFKLLADAANLDCVVVTGYLDGSLGHAWNRVDIGDGQWATVDSTNNDAETMPNALLNVPDSVIATTLVEDKAWIVDSSFAQYKNESDVYEFYRTEGLFFDQDAIVGKIVSALSSSNVVVLRTDYMLNDPQFYEIGKKVAEATGNDELAGYYWMGIVVIASDSSKIA